MAFNFTVFPFEKQSTLQLTPVQQVLQAFLKFSSGSTSGKVRWALDDSATVTGVRADARPSVGFDGGLG